MSFTSMDKSFKQEIQKETLVLNAILDLMDFIDTYRTFYPTRTEYTFFSGVHEIFSRIDHMVGHKTSQQI